MRYPELCLGCRAKQSISNWNIFLIEVPFRMPTNEGLLIFLLISTGVCSKKKYQHLISDSRIKKVINKQIEIFDSTTISLFQEDRKCVGRAPADGKRKGGIKMHTVINVDETVPKMVWFTDASTSDHSL